MSHILHLLGPQLSVRLTQEQLAIADKETKTERTVPIEDIGMLICATPTASFTAGALKRLAEENVPVLICNERFEPACLTLPYYRATDTDLLRKQVAWTAEEKDALFRQVITAKVANQAANLEGKTGDALRMIANRCEQGSFRPETEPGPGRRIATVTLSRREWLHADTPGASESRAARLYWRRVLPELAGLLGTDETTRKPGTREGVNGMLDYGYAILRSTVLRALAARGFIAALGIFHAARAGSFALADDLMEPLRPFMDRALRRHLEATSGADMSAWARQAAAQLLEPVNMPTGNLRLINAIDSYVQSFASATMRGAGVKLTIPLLLPLT